MPPVVERTVGSRPAIPGTLGRWSALFGTIPAERLAALRIAVALTFLADLAWSYLPHLSTLFGPNGLTPPELFAERFQTPSQRWSLLRLLPQTWGPTLLIGSAVVLGVGLLLGVRTRMCALGCWAIAVSLFHANPFFANSGDLLRTFALLLVAACPSGSVWARDARTRPGERLLAYRWPVTLILAQLTFVYGISGIYKLMAPAWRDGTVMLDVLRDANWSLVPGLADSIPLTVLKVTAWVTLGWELLFPVLILQRTTRIAALALGAAFHIGTAFTLEVGLFPWYALCLYVPFLPWERFSRSPGS